MASDQSRKDAMVVQTDFEKGWQGALLAVIDSIREEEALLAESYAHKGWAAGARVARERVTLMLRAVPGLREAK